MPAISAMRPLRTLTGTGKAVGDWSSRCLNDRRTKPLSNSCVRLPRIWPPFSLLTPLWRMPSPVRQEPPMKKRVRSEIGAP